MQCGAVASMKGCTILPAAARRLYAFCSVGMVWTGDVAYFFDALKIQLILKCVTDVRVLVLGLHTYLEG